MDDADVGGWTAERHVTSLYRAHALSLARLALVMLGDRHGRRRTWCRTPSSASTAAGTGWPDPSAVAQSYLRTSVLNGCRTALRHPAAARRPCLTAAMRTAAVPGSSQSLPLPRSLSLSLGSAEATVVHDEEQRAVLAADPAAPGPAAGGARAPLLPRPHGKNRPPDAMQVSRGTVKSATSRAIAAVGRMLGAPDGKTRSGEGS